uniref:Uncharacterized protein n=1 Tax=Lutzomyia longipalpis TaxID=7200 RepID=A0A7G3B7I5_LUTLO
MEKRIFWRTFLFGFLYCRGTFSSTNFLRSSSSSSDELCVIPRYVVKEVFIMNVLSTVDVSCPYLYGTTGSQSPCPWKMGTVFGHLRAAGKFLWSGSHDESAMTPARGSGKVSAAYSASAPPCEKPPMIIRPAEMPSLISPAMSLCTFAVAARIPSSSCGPDTSRVLRSNHDGILKPALRVTGIVGAVGHITFILGVRIPAIAVAQPCPVSPRPCRKINVAVCLAVAAITTGATDIFLELLKLSAFWTLGKYWEMHNK